ncbi:hypothetical protein GJAV_G00147650 [Gymnothorax javanicus]|nr:hypothetical protein GJAV_G00147650 [Gymnothorax javanicus]
MGLDRESDLVHMEVHTSDGRDLYITCRVQACSESNRNHPFPGYIDPNSLVIQDNYIFIQTTTAGRSSYYVSYQREPFMRIKIPKYSLPKDLHIISTDENQVFAAIQEWNQNDTYNLYISDPRGIHFTLALENVKTSKGLEGNIMIDLYEVAGIKGMFIANRKHENQVKTYITYNKGRDWRLLQAPTVDLNGNDIHCILIFEEEHSIWFLDKGGALLAVKQANVPVRNIWISFDEGRQWSRHSVSLVPLYVDGVLVEPGIENQIMTFFGHFSHRSEWQLIKIDYRSIFTRRCTEGDYQTWHLHNQGEPCVMGEKQIYMKRRPGNHCMLGRDYARILSAEPCICKASDFEW